MGDGIGTRAISSRRGVRARARGIRWALAVTPTAVAALAGAASAHSAGAVETNAYDRLLVLVLVIGTAIASFVFAVMLYGIWRFREGNDLPRAPPKVHDRRLESAWTAAPIVILVIIAALSTAALVESDTPPENAITIKALGIQWQWVFTYPDGNISINDLYIEEGQHVIFEIRSADVVHSFFLPQFNLKVDAFPNKTYETWIHADRVGEFDLYCAEFCGLEHGEMQGRLIVFPKGTQDKPYGPPPSAQPPPPPPSDNVTVVLGIDGTGTQPPTFAVTPVVVNVHTGANLRMHVRNNTTRAFNFTLGPPYMLALDVAPEGSAWLNFTASRPTAGDPIGVRVQGGAENVTGSLLVVGARSSPPATSGGGGGGGSQWVAWALAGVATLLLLIVLMLALRAPDRAEADTAPGGGGGDV